MADSWRRPFPRKPRLLTSRQAGPAIEARNGNAATGDMVPVRHVWGHRVNGVSCAVASETERRAEGPFRPGVLRLPMATTKSDCVLDARHRARPGPRRLVWKPDFRHARQGAGERHPAEPAHPRPDVYGLTQPVGPVDQDDRHDQVLLILQMPPDQLLQLGQSIAKRPPHPHSDRPRLPPEWPRWPVPRSG